MKLRVNFYGNESVFILFVVMSLTFYLFPQIDIATTQLFWSLNGGFFLGNEPVFQVLYWVFAKISVPIAMLLLIYLSVGLMLDKYLQKSLSNFFMQYKSDAIFLLLLLVLGAVFIEGFLKGVWGRARPRDVLEFGGSMQFTPAWVISGQCLKNCSFMSGHASFGFYFMAFGWVVKKKVWLLPGFILGLSLSVTRIVQGGHFLSDTVLTFFVVYLMAQLLSKMVYKEQF